MSNNELRAWLGTFERPFMDFCNVVDLVALFGAVPEHRHRQYIEMSRESRRRAKQA